MSFPFFFHRDPDTPGTYVVDPKVVIQAPALMAAGRREREIVQGFYYRDRGFYSPRLQLYVQLDVFLKDPDTHEYVRCPSQNEIWAQVNRVLAARDGEIALCFGLDGNVSKLETYLH